MADEITVEEELAAEPTEKVGEGLEAPEAKPEERTGEDKEKYSHRVQKSINRYARKAGEAEIEAERLRKEVEELRAKTQIKTEPTQDDYSDYEAYKADKDQWNTQEKDKIKAQAKQELEQEQIQKRQQEEWNKVNQTYAEKKAKKLESDPEHGAKEARVVELLTVHGEYAIPCRNAILKATNSAELVDYFDKHPDKMQDIVLQSPEDQLRSIWELDKEVQAQAPKTKSTAPDPTRPVKGGAGQVTKPISQMSQKEYNIWCKENGK